MHAQWKQVTELADVRLPESHPPFPDQLPDQDGRVAEWLNNTRVIPFWAREWRCRPGWSVGPRVMNHCVWWVFPDSGGWISLPREKKTIRFGPGDLILMPEGIEHAVGLSRKRGNMRQFAGHFNANVYGSINLLKLLGFPIYIPSSRGAPFHDVAMHLVREYEIKAPGWQEAMASELLAFLFYLVRNYGSLFNPFNHEHAHKNLPRLLPVFETIESRLDDPELKVSDLAARIHVSEVYLRRLFRLVTGMRIVSFIQRRRIDKACILLRHEPFSVKKVAEACGFRETTFFYRAFKHWMHGTPGQFRQSQVS